MVPALRLLVMDENLRILDKIGVCCVRCDVCRQFYDISVRVTSLPYIKNQNCADAICNEDKIPEFLLYAKRAKIII